MTPRTVAAKLAKLMYDDEVHSGMQPYAGLLLAKHRITAQGDGVLLTLIFSDGMGGPKQTEERFLITKVEP